VSENPKNNLSPVNREKYFFLGNGCEKKGKGYLRQEKLKQRDGCIKKIVCML